MKHTKHINSKVFRSHYHNDDDDDDEDVLVIRDDNNNDDMNEFNTATLGHFSTIKHQFMGWTINMLSELIHSIQFIHFDFTFA